MKIGAGSGFTGGAAIGSADAGDGAIAIGAAIVPAKGEMLDPATLAAAAKARLSAFKLPSRWAILGSVDDLPRTGSGKIDKAALQAQLMAQA